MEGTAKLVFGIVNKNTFKCNQYASAEDAKKFMDAIKELGLLDTFMLVSGESKDDLDTIISKMKDDASCTADGKLPVQSPSKASSTSSP